MVDLVGLCNQSMSTISTVIAMWEHIASGNVANDIRELTNQRTHTLEAVE